MSEVLWCTFYRTDRLCQKYYGGVSATDSVRNPVVEYILPSFLFGNQDTVKCPSDRASFTEDILLLLLQYPPLAIQVPSSMEGSELVANSVPTEPTMIHCHQTVEL